MVKYAELKGNCFELWFADKKAMLAIMHSNLAADLNCGYDYMGKSVQAQLATIDRYRAELNETMDSFGKMTESEIDHYCYYDMIKRGVIE